MQVDNAGICPGKLAWVLRQELELEEQPGLSVLDT